VATKPNIYATDRERNEAFLKDYESQMAHLRQQLKKAPNDDRVKSIEGEIENLSIYRDRILAGKNKDGSAIRPEFNSLIDPKTGLLKQPYQLQALPDIKVDSRAMDAIREDALSQGPSKYAQLMEERQRLEQSDLLDQSRAQISGAQAQTMSDLAMSGGLSSGARERLASKGMDQQAIEAQKIARSGMLDRMNIGLQDQTRKDDLLKSTVGYDFQNANVANQNRAYQTDVNRTNIESALNENNAGRMFDMTKYQEEMKKWAAGKTADVQKSAASGGGKK
jgi:hypothetical protein